MLCKEIHLKGIPICRGIAIGRIFIYSMCDDVEISEFSIDPSKIEAEVLRYQTAVLSSLNEIKQLQARMNEKQISDGAAILDGHLQMIQDSLLTTHVEQRIREELKNAEFVFKSVILECEEKFNSISDPFFRARFKDVQEISKRVLGHLREHVKLRLTDLPQDSIIFSNDLSAFDTAEALSMNVTAFVTRDGGANSHAAIVAKGKGIPFVSSVDIDLVPEDEDGWVIVDGRTGEIIINPTLETLQKYRQLRLQLLRHLHKLEEAAKHESETYDGYLVQLSANVEGVAEVEMLHLSGGSGVGLLRTESPFLSRHELPFEEEQYQLYRLFIEKMRGLPIVIRTFDIGGDKTLRTPTSAPAIPLETNPFLGCRAIRFLLREVDIFKTQLRAILRASVFGNVKIMFPMISSLGELLEAKAILEEVKQELISQGIATPPHIPVGCMIEVPSSAVIADLLVKECDFLSIGTNDLVQYTLAVDRTNNMLRNLYAPAHPSVIRLIRLIVNSASERGIPVSICGEVAADPRFTPLLLGLRVSELSVAARYIPVIKNAIRRTSFIAATKLAEAALALSSAEEIEDLLTKEYRRSVPDDCFYNC